MFWLVSFIIFLILWAVAAFYLDGPSLRQFDGRPVEPFPDHPDDATANAKFMEQVQSLRRSAKQTKSLRKSIQMIRHFADNLSQGHSTSSEFISVNSNGIDAEWAIAPGVDTQRRVLFFHGGAFMCTAINCLN
jgi:acetyl esterase/lipase